MAPEGVAGLQEAAGLQELQELQAASIEKSREMITTTSNAKRQTAKKLLPVT